MFRSSARILPGTMALRRRGIVSAPSFSMPEWPNSIFAGKKSFCFSVFKALPLPVESLAIENRGSWLWCS